MNGKIEDIDLSGSALGRLKDFTEYYSYAECDSAVQALVKAAVKAREEERDAAAKSALAGNLLPPTYDQDAAGEVASACPDLEARFLYFYERFTAYPQTVSGYLQQAKTALSSARLSPMNNVDDAMVHWAGESKHDFMTYFVNPMIDFAVPNQQAVLDDLIVAMSAYEGLIQAAHVDAKVVADEATQVLDSLNDWTSEDTQQLLDMVGIGIDIAGSDEGINGGSKKATLSGKLGLVGIGISAVETGVNASTNIDSDGALDVMREVDKILTDMKTTMDAEEEAIRDALNTSLGAIQGVLNSDESLDSATLLPLEPKGDNTPNLTEGKTPHGYPNFYPHG